MWLLDVKMPKRVAALAARPGRASLAIQPPGGLEHDDLDGPGVGFQLNHA